MFTAQAVILQNLVRAARSFFAVTGSQKQFTPATRATRRRWSYNSKRLSSISQNFMEKKTFVVGKTYTCADWYMIEANSEEEAITIAKDPNGKKIALNESPSVVSSLSEKDWIVRDNWKNCIICGKIHEGEHYHD